VRDPADQIIYATAVECGSRLVSRDSRLKSHDPARIIW
jgi:PIN domain nuclease of toxin-antitoxin system